MPPLRIPEVPRPWPGSMAERSGGRTARIWYADGFWWFRGKGDGAAREIGSVMRRTLYDLNEMARELGLAERTFQRLVREEFGQSAGRWLRSLRAVEMRQRIIAGGSIGTISREFGFRHQSDFRAEFWRWHQVNPTAFRKRCMEQVMGGSA